MSILNHFGKLLFLFFVLTLASCGQCSNKRGSDEYTEFKTELSQNEQKALESFANYPVNKQIDIVLYAQNCRRDRHVEPLLIKDGKDKIPAIVERIVKEEDPWDKSQLVAILIGINTACRCIKRDSDVIKTLEAISRNLDEENRVQANDLYKQSYKDGVLVLKKQLEKGDN